MKLCNPTKKLTEAERHRAAAWWAGEGSVSCRDRKLVVSVAQKEINVLEWFAELFGGSILTRNCNGNIISYWSLCGPRARRFLTAIYGCLPESPRRQAQIIHALCETGGPKRKKGPVPNIYCRKGHRRNAGDRDCLICANAATRARRRNPVVAEKHRQNSRERYARNKALVA